MKKVFMVVAAALMMTAASVKAQAVVAAPEVAEAQKGAVSYELKLSLHDMHKAMKLDIDQFDNMERVTRNFERRISNLAYVDPEKRQEKLTAYVAENLMNAQGYLDEMQYRTYLKLLNVEFNKTGLNSVLYGYDMVAFTE